MSEPSSPASQRLYFDNAATSWPKPESVYEAVDHYQRSIGAPGGRSHTRDAESVARAISQTRTAIADLIGCRQSRQIVFAFNGTDALNTAIFGLVRSGDHVVTTDAEHNSVLRPLRFLEKSQDVSVSRVPCDAAGAVDLDSMRSEITDRTRLVCLIHASNVTGTIQDIDAVGEMAHAHGAALLVDAAQTVGHVEIDVSNSPVDLLAAPGHKGLFGPLGTGFLYLSEKWEQQVQPFRFGGTGTQSDEDVQPITLPERFESGNANIPGLYGLGAGLSYVQQRSVAKIREHERLVATQLTEGLRSIADVTIQGHENWERRCGVISFSIENHDPREVSLILDDAFGIQSRSGFHCAPRLHRAMGTAHQGGTVRLSPGLFNDRDQAQHVVDAVREIAGSR